MSLATKRERRVEVMIPQTWLSRMMKQAKKAGVRMTPVAGSARDAAAHRIEDARLWAAPKLDQAAQSVEEQIAPIVSAFLAELARRIDVSATRKPRRRWPVAALCTGAALGAIGVAVYRGNAQRWSGDTMREDTMRENVRDTASDAGRWVGEKAEEVRGATGKATDEVKGKMS